ncbi:MAG TPA: polysaccharide biosynthesis/export family protein [Bacteroidota bacterium]|nr:polysaccharide biosynthesis/export family protein [Bacteroidota bacterium]
MINKFLLVLSITCILSASIFAQLNLNEKKDDSFSQREQLQTQTQYQQNLQNVKMAVMDGPVDPKEYIVGPGDVYSVNVWISPPLNLLLTITPEGSVVIPTVGEISVAGLPLDEAKKKVVAEIHKKYISGAATFTLVNPRMLAVRVTGFGLIENTVYVLATERAQDAIALAKNQTDEALKAMSEANVASKTIKLSNDEVRKLSAEGSTRKVTVRHKDGTESPADIEKYIATKDWRCDPLLRDGDVVIVPEKNDTRNFVGVFGAVNSDGDYEFVDGDSLLTLLLIARGCSPLADSANVIISRTDVEGNTLQSIAVDLRAIAAGTSANVPLRRGDRILVKQKTELQHDYRVNIEGEITYPGSYPITRDSTTLSEVVQWAGGFTSNASLEGSRILRNTKKTPVDNSRGKTSQEDSTYFRIENELLLNGELVVADFAGLFNKNDKSKDVYLRDGDRIIIAPKAGTVYVFGQVIRPGHVAFSRNQSYKYYIEQAGGLADDAVSGDIHIIKASSKQWLSPSETTVEEGDYIWVPKEPYRSFSYYMQIYGQLFSIIGTIVTAAVLVVQLKK